MSVPRTGRSSAVFGRPTEAEGGGPRAFFSGINMWPTGVNGAVRTASSSTKGWRVPRMGLSKAVGRAMVGAAASVASPISSGASIGALTSSSSMASPMSSMAASSCGTMAGWEIGWRTVRTGSGWAMGWRTLRTGGTWPASGRALVIGARMLPRPKRGSSCACCPIKPRSGRPAAAPKPSGRAPSADGSMAPAPKAAGACPEMDCIHFWRFSARVSVA